MFDSKSESEDFHQVWDIRIIPLVEYTKYPTPNENIRVKGRKGLRIYELFHRTLCSDQNG